MAEVRAGAARARALRHGAAALLVTLAAAGCADEVEPLYIKRCSRDAECKAGTVCEAGECVPKDTVSCQAVEGGKAILQPGPPLVDFGDTSPATSFRSVTLRNIGNCTLTLFEAYFEREGESPFVCPDCTPSRFPIELFPFREHEVEVAFTPTEVGSFDDRLVLLSDDAEFTEIKIPIRAHYAGAPEARIAPAELDFGFVAAGRSRALSLKLTNASAGTAPLRVEKIELLPTGTTAFAFAPELSEALTLAPIRRDNSAIQTIDVTYRPREFGRHRGELVITTNQPRGGILRVPIQGSSETPPKIEPSPEQIDFGPVPLGRTTALPLTIVNQGGSPLEVRYVWGGPEGTTDFAARPAIVPKIEAGQYSEIQVLFTPTVAGPASGLLLLESNDGQRPSISIPLSGVGEDVLGGQVVKIELAFDNGSDSAFDDDLRNVDLMLENPFGLVCSKQDPNPTNWQSFGEPTWLALGVNEEPERVVLPNAQADGTYRVILSYAEDCSFLPSDLLAGVLGISVDVLIGVLAGAPIGVGGDDVSGVIDDVCFDHDGTSAALTVWANGQVIGEKTVRLDKKGDTIYALDLIRQGGQYTVR